MRRNSTVQALGLLSGNSPGRPELHGYSITMDGSVVAQKWPSDFTLSDHVSRSDEYIGDDLTWEDLLPNNLMPSVNAMDNYRIATELRAA